MQRREHLSRRSHKISAIQTLIGLAQDRGILASLPHLLATQIHIHSHTLPHDLSQGNCSIVGGPDLGHELYTWGQPCHTIWTGYWGRILKWKLGVVFKRRKSGYQRYSLFGYYHISCCSVIIRSCFFPPLLHLISNTFLCYIGYNSLIYLGFSPFAFLIHQFRHHCFILCQTDSSDSPEMFCGLSDLRVSAFIDCFA